MLFSAGVDLAAGGSVLTMVSPDGSDFSVILETGKTSCAHCRYGAGTFATAAQTITLDLIGSLAAHTEVSVWHTNQTHTFIKVAV